MRCSLPVDPTFKTWVEVSTIAFLRAKTTVPVPKVIAYSSSPDNAIGFEWILMERVPDVGPLKQAWPRLPWDAKITLVESIGDVLGRLFEIRADVIGNIYQGDMANSEEVEEEEEEEEEKQEQKKKKKKEKRKEKTKKEKKSSPFVVSRLVSMPFFWGDHIQLGQIPQGPFTSNRDWLHARLQMLLHDCTVLLASSTSSAFEKEDAVSPQAVARRLLTLLPFIFPAEEEPEAFALHHDDLSHRNILVDQTGALKVIVDWECTSTMPLFKCCQLPSFLQGRERLEKPNMDEYGDITDENSLYPEHLHDYELTVLRGHFIEVMQAKYPAWAKEYHTADMNVNVRAKFEYAVSTCDGPFSVSETERWLDRIEMEMEMEMQKDRSHP